MTVFKGPTAQFIGYLLTRIVVPLWIFIGAIFKLMETSPRTLPKISILNPAAHYEINLYWLLAILISLEFLAVCIMVFLKPFARAMAIFMLGSFCLILLNEIRGGATSCGCLGTFSPSPWMMLSIDGLMLLGTVACASKPSKTLYPSRWSFGLALIGIFLGTAVSFAVLIPAGRVPDAMQPESNNENDSPGAEVPSDFRVNPNPKPLQGYWYVENIEEWIGKPWREVELFHTMPKWPVGLDQGERYIVFYSRTCDHCEDMFWNDLIKPYDPPVIAIEIPVDKETLTAPNAWELPMTNCVLMNLPVGTDWIITSPLVLRIENGTVTCAEEGDHKECLRLK